MSLQEFSCFWNNNSSELMISDVSTAAARSHSGSLLIIIDLHINLLIDPHRLSLVLIPVGPLVLQKL